MFIFILTFTTKKQNSFQLAVKGIIIIYLPAILITFIIYKVFMGRNTELYRNRSLLIGVIIGIFTIRNYDHRTLEVDIKCFKVLKERLIKRRWEIVAYNDSWLLIKPKFDFPFRTFIDDAVQVNYFNNKANIEGAWYYISSLKRDIEGKNGFLSSRVTGIAMIVIIFFLVSVPFLGGWGIF